MDREFFVILAIILAVILLVGAALLAYAGKMFFAAIWLAMGLFNAGLAWKNWNILQKWRRL